jgi:hypothetical protein
MRKGTARKILFACIVVAIALSAFEITARVFGLGQAPAETLFTDIYDVQYEMLPGALNPWSDVKNFLNADGLRCYNADKERTPGVARILTLGDSVTFGSHVTQKQTYSALLEKSFRSRDMQVEVLNGGLPGTNLYQQVLLYERKLAAYSPDLLIVYTTPNFRSDFYELRRRLERIPWEADLKRGLAKSHLYRFLRRLIKPITVESVYSQHMQTWKPPAKALLSKPRAQNDAIMDMKKLAELADRSGARLVVIGIMPRDVINDGAAAGLAPDSKQWNLMYKDKNLASLIPQIAKDMGIKTIEPEHEFLAATPDRELFVDVVHFTSEGHALFAQILETEICTNNLLPTPCPLSQ